MANYKIATFTEGNVYTDGWWYPSEGQRVYLYLEATGDLYVARSEETTALCAAIAYTWPRKGSNLHAAQLAWRHYERKTA